MRRWRATRAGGVASLAQMAARHSAKPLRDTTFAGQARQRRLPPHNRLHLVRRESEANPLIEKKYFFERRANAHDGEPKDFQAEAAML